MKRLAIALALCVVCTLAFGQVYFDGMFRRLQCWTSADESGDPAGGATIPVMIGTTNASATSPVAWPSNTVIGMMANNYETAPACSDANTTNCGGANIIAHAHGITIATTQDVFATNLNERINLDGILSADSPGFEVWLDNEQVFSIFNNTTSSPPDGLVCTVDARFENGVEIGPSLANDTTCSGGTAACSLLVTGHAHINGDLSVTGSSPLSGGAPSSSANDFLIDANTAGVGMSILSTNTASPQIRLRQENGASDRELALYLVGTTGAGLFELPNTLNIKSGAGSALTAPTDADDLVLDLPATGGMTILTPTTASASCYYIGHSSTKKHKVCVEATTSDMVIAASIDEPVRIFSDSSRSGSMTLNATTNDLSITGTSSGSLFSVAGTTTSTFSNSTTFNGAFSGTAGGSWAATDVTYRTSADLIVTNDDGTATTLYLKARSGDTPFVLEDQSTGNDWLTIDRAGKFQWADGVGGATDLTLTRGAADRLDLGTGDSLKTSSTGQLIGGTRWSLSAGKSAFNADAYLDTNGVTMASTVGFPMARAGSVIGVSCLVNCGFHVANGQVSCEVYKNGAEVFETVTATITSAAAFTASTTQAPGVDTFAANDTISLHVDWDATYNCTSSVIMVVELQQDS